MLITQNLSLVTLIQNSYVLSVKLSAAQKQIFTNRALRLPIRTQNDLAERLRREKVHTTTQIKNAQKRIQKAVMEEKKRIFSAAEEMTQKREKKDLSDLFL